MLACLSRPLFYSRPRSAAPLFDFRFVALSRTLLRLLAGPAQGVQDPANVVGMIPHFEMLLDYVGNPRTRPLIGCVPGRERTFLENGYQAPLLLARQTRAPTCMYAAWVARNPNHRPSTHHSNASPRRARRLRFSPLRELPYPQAIVVRRSLVELPIPLVFLQVSFTQDNARCSIINAGSNRRRPVQNHCQTEAQGGS